MANNRVDWGLWRAFFEKRCERPLPEPDDSQDYSFLPDSFAKSLAIFQLGESGGGTVIGMTRNSGLDGITNDYSDAIALFVKEENYHADILAVCVRLLGGTLIQKNWTAKLFVFARRLMGVRLKIVVLLAAEVVGLCYYYLLASKLPACQVRDLLMKLVEDERSHLYFHCHFLKSQTPNAIKRAIFVVIWRSTMLAAAIAVVIDHRAAIRDMNLGLEEIWQRWMSYSRSAERLVTGRASPDLRLRDSQLL